jgi:cell volume regulation protein A
MDAAHELILLGGLLGLVTIFAGLISSRFGAPLLLVFLVIGMVVGEDGLGGIEFDDFWVAYLIGSIALAVILFEGGLKTERGMLKAAFWPSLALATIGVALTAGVVGATEHWLAGIAWPEALLVGAAVAPTDAAAVAMMLRRAKIALPHRVTAALEIESGLNDPMAVFLTVLLVDFLVLPHPVTIGHAALSFVQEMGGGGVIGLGAGFALLWLLRRPRVEIALAPVLALVAALAVFGAAQRLGTSGFLALYVMAFVVGTHEHKAHQAVERFFETFGWLAQIVLFLMLGLLVTPHELVPLLAPTLVVAAVLIFVARPIATFACLMPFRYTLRETAFASWVGLRGAVPIYLTIIPVLAGAKSGVFLFGAAFVIVIVSLVAQGWTIGLAAKLLGFGKAAT